jgi:hypothetical protein
MGVQFTRTGDLELALTLDRATSKALPETTKVIGRASFNIKNHWKKLWSGFPHLPALPGAINYDIYPTLAGNVESEIGVDKTRRQGELGNIIAFGSPTSAPIPGPLTALDAEAPKFESALAALGAKLLGEQ